VYSGRFVTSWSMAQVSKIEWSDLTWNPATGCTKISPGCDRCYAERFAERWRGIPGHPYEQGFALRLHPSRLQQPLAIRRPSFVFVNSMSDLFHKEIPYSFVDQVFEVMEQAHWHVFQVLTKRSSRMRRYINSRYSGSLVPRHIWLGVSIEGPQQLSRFPHLANTNWAAPGFVDTILS
jgi:protein gp37